MPLLYIPKKLSSKFKQSHIVYRISYIDYRLSLYLIRYVLLPSFSININYQFFTFSFQLSPFNFLLSTFHFQLSPFNYPFPLRQRLQRIAFARGAGKTMSEKRGTKSQSEHVELWLSGRRPKTKAI
jgi:hypothetical protein